MIPLSNFVQECVFFSVACCGKDHPRVHPMAARDGVHRPFGRERCNASRVRREQASWNSNWGKEWEIRVTSLESQKQWKNISTHKESWLPGGSGTNKNGYYRIIYLLIWHAKELVRRARGSSTALWGGCAGDPFGCSSGEAEMQPMCRDQLHSLRRMSGECVLALAPNPPEDEGTPLFCVYAACSCGLCPEKNGSAADEGSYIFLFSIST